MEYLAHGHDKDLISQLSDSNLRLAIRRTRLQAAMRGESAKERQRVGRARRYMQALKSELKSRKGGTVTKKKKKTAAKRKTVKRKTVSRSRSKMVLSKLKKDGIVIDNQGYLKADDDLYMAQS